MIDVPAVREALATALHDVYGGVVAVYIKVPHTPDRIPCLIVYPPETIEYRVASRTDRAVFTVLLLARPTDPHAQALLEAAMSSTGDLSFPLAVHADRTLGGVTSNLRVLDMSAGTFTVSIGPDADAVGCEFRVEVLA